MAEVVADGLVCSGSEVSLRCLYHGFGGSGMRDHKSGARRLTLTQLDEAGTRVADIDVVDAPAGHRSEVEGAGLLLTGIGVAAAVTNLVSFASGRWTRQWS